MGFYTFSSLSIYMIEPQFEYLWVEDFSESMQPDLLTAILEDTALPG